MSDNPLVVEAPSDAVEAPTQEAEQQAPEQVQETPKQTAVSGTSARDYIKDDWSFNEEAFKNIPLDEGENPEKYAALGNKFNSLPGLAKSYLNLERMLSKEKVPIPSENDGDEVWEHAYKALGRPEKAEYKAPEGFDPEAKKATDEIFFEAGLSQRQADKIYSRIQSAMEESSQQGEANSGAQVEQAVQALENDFGPRGGPMYQKALDKAQTVAQHLGIDVPEFWTMPGFASKLASRYDSLIGSDIVGVSHTGISNAQSIQDQIADIQTNPSNPHYTAYRDGDKAIHDRVLKLYEQLDEVRMGNT